jgi:hypothetical protein
MAAAVLLLGLTPNLGANPFNGAPDYQVDALGYYYAITGGKFPTGTTPNGDNASGGTFRFLLDDPAWGAYPLDQWNKDDWFPINASIGLTLKNAGAIVYDNNGLEPGASDPADPHYYDYNYYSTVGKGAHVAYSMSNNYDWIYAGYFKLTGATTITQLIGYFAWSGNPNDALHGPFDPNNPLFRYHMNVFSNVSGDLLPANTGSFAGDVFSSDNTPGTFSWSDTGFDRIGASSQQNIYRLVYTLDAPITLQPGVYWFSHDASIVPLPAAAWTGLVGLGAMAFGHWIRSRRNSK